MPKSLSVAIIVISALILVGAFFFLNKNQSQVQVASYTSKDVQKPRVEVKTTFFDMGEIKVSDQKKAEFTLKNVGSKSLQLFNISSSCGCTVGQIVYEGKESQEFGMHSAGSFNREISSGKEAKVRVIYRPYVMPVYGPVEREVYLSTNDPDNPKLVFKVKAYVK